MGESAFKFQNQLFVSFTDTMAHCEIRGLSRSDLWGRIVGEGSLGRSPIIELQRPAVCEAERCHV